MAPNLRDFHIRRNALLKRIDYHFHLNLYLDNNFTQWIKLNAKSYERTGREIAQILGRLEWKMLSDKDYKIISSRRTPY
jgi:hypothetical protein